MPQVKSAEILMKKTLPDLAQAEIRSKNLTAHVVMIPPTSTPDEWHKQVKQITNEPNYLESAARPVDGVAVVSD